MNVHCSICHTLNV
ncbi:hypothetical protein BUY57_08720 [Staphylococcus epidermidis]|nr:hypothetical protein BUY57_08720 [Staphylococcus epidermidis]